MTASPETAPPETAGDGGTGTESAEETGETGEAAGNMPEEAGPAASDTEAEPASSAPADPQEISGTEGETADDTATQTLSYVYTMPALPANASLEQRNLGFAYQSPILGALSSTFGWRDHPVDGENKFHYGVDLAAAEGADICAFADGKVYATGESSTLGNYIMLEHPGGYITLYAHCSRVTVTGGAVSMGDKIAEVGQTGVATGPHLHFELHDGSLYLNPIYYVQVR
ncbi:MAG TPA: peptidoglycan DD-metalloendopeptidase family protein [Candidatus Pelethomonas intestinigallinarum]|nr:peptidoglycan DD-metalloendopeptidase family protein [Candidatus Pelethomonas intestinigallinarum]